MNEKSAWSHLPNAVHIDRVIASVNTHPEEWIAAWRSPVSVSDASWAAAADAAYDAARDAAWDAAFGAAFDAARDAAWDAESDATRDAAWVEAFDAAWGAITALIAWDDSFKWLDIPSDQLEVWAVLSDAPACILLLSAVVAFEKIEELEVA